MPHYSQVYSCLRDLDFDKERMLILLRLNLKVDGVKWTNETGAKKFQSTVT